jgi:hypothetical protein
VKKHSGLTIQVRCLVNPNVLKFRTLVPGDLCPVIHVSKLKDRASREIKPLALLIPLGVRTIEPIVGRVDQAARLGQVWEVFPDKKGVVVRAVHILKSTSQECPTLARPSGTTKEHLFDVIQGKKEVLFRAGRSANIFRPAGCKAPDEVVSGLAIR